MLRFNFMQRKLLVNIMKRKIALIIVSLMVLMSINAVASVIGERGYAFADDNAAITTNISVEGDIATLDIYVSGGIYGFTGLSFGYKYDAAALALLNTDAVKRGNSKLDIGGSWLESFSVKPGEINYFIASTGEFESYRNGESEKLFSIEFKINTLGGENSISYLADLSFITCGDTNIYLSPKSTSETMFDGSDIFKLTKDFIPDKIEITDKGALEIASRSRGTPRIANRFLKRVRDFAEVKEWQCCGAVYPVSRDEVATKLSAVRTLNAAKVEGEGKLLTLCSACHHVLKRVNGDMKNDENIRFKANNYLGLEEEYAGETDVIHYLELLRDYVGFDNLKKCFKNNFGEIFEKNNFAKPYPRNPDPGFPDPDFPVLEKPDLENPAQ